jgi:hypothetical protein
MFIRDLSSGNKADAVAMWNTQLHLVLRLRMSGVVPPFPYTFA